MSGSTIAVNVPLSRRTAAVATLLVALLGLTVSLAAAPPPLPDLKAGLPGLLPWLPYGTGVLALIAGGLSLLVVPPAPRPEVENPAVALVPGLQAIFRDFNGLLMEERDRLAAFQEAFGTTTKEAMAATSRLTKLAAAATDAEYRLGAGVAQAEQALRQPAADAAHLMQRALPELAAVIQRGAADLSRTVLEADCSRMASEAEGSIQAFRDTVAQASGQIAMFGETADKLRQDITGLDLAGRQIATASAVVVARVGEAVGHFDAALTTLPTTVAAVSDAAQEASRAVTEAARALAADGAALHACGRQAAEAIGERMEAAGQTLRDAGEAAAGMLSAASRPVADQLAVTLRAIQAAGDAMAGQANEAGIACRDLPAVMTIVTAAADQAAQTLAEAAAAFRNEGAAQGDTLAAVVRETTQALLGAGQDVRTAAQQAASQTERALARVDAAMTLLPELAASLDAAADQAVHSLTAAGTTLSAQGIDLSAAGREALRVVETLRTTGQAIATVVDAVAGRPIATSVTERLEACASVLEDHTSLLGALGERIADRLAVSTPGPDVEMRAPPEPPTAEPAPGLPAELNDPPVMAATFSALATEIGEALHRFEAVLAHHTDTWPAAVESMAKVQTAMTDVRAAMEAPAVGKPDLPEARRAPAALTATLAHLDGVAAGADQLLHQTKVLAEAVLSGRAPGLPPVLADRTPALLAEVEMTVRRLQAVSAELARTGGSTRPARERRSG